MNLENENLISIIMNCHNGDKFLKDAVNSVINQTYQNWEIIFFNNSSKDNSEKIIKAFKDPRIRIYNSQKYLKLYEARNRAIELSCGSLICFLDVDDKWDFKKLEKQVQILSKKNYEFVYTNFYRFTNKKKTIAHKSSIPEGLITDSLLNNYSIGMSSVMIKRDCLLKRTPPFNKTYEIIGDFDAFLNLSLTSKFKFLNEPLTYIRIHEENLSFKKQTTHIKELGRWYEEHQNKQIGKVNNFYKIEKIIWYLQGTNLINKGSYQKLLLHFMKPTGFYYKLRLISKFILMKIIN